MSSRKRRERGDHGDAFDSQNPPAPTSSLESFSDLLYGSGRVADDLKRIDARTVRVRNLALTAISPDPAQARRVMPGLLRARWLADPAAIPEVLHEWLMRANAEAEGRGRPPLDVPAALESDPDNQMPLPEEPDLPDAGPVEDSFRALLQLAASIRHHGLANPITVVSASEHAYLIESGERRLLAYHLLHSLPDYVEGDWSSIPARVVESKDIWRQAAENGARQDLNAISVARQLALLLMDVYRDQSEFAPYDSMPGVGWYAQVADSKRFPVPYGRGPELAAVMGLKSAGQLRQYRQLLHLPNEVWELADEMNWTEFRIRNLLHRARSVTTVTDGGADPPGDPESVTVVTDLIVDGSSYVTYLTELARLEAGLVSELPPELVRLEKQAKRQQVAGGVGAAGRGQGRKVAGRKKLLLEGVEVEVGQVDLVAGALTLHIGQPDLLEALLSGERLLLTLHRPPTTET
jgi:hypothetical protein